MRSPDRLDLAIVSTLRFASSDLVVVDELPRRPGKVRGDALHVAVASRLDDGGVLDNEPSFAQSHSLSVISSGSSLAGLTRSIRLVNYIKCFSQSMSHSYLMLIRAIIGSLGGDLAVVFPKDLAVMGLK